MIVKVFISCLLTPYIVEQLLSIFIDNNLLHKPLDCKISCKKTLETRLTNLSRKQNNQECTNAAVGVYLTITTNKSYLHQNYSSFILEK